MSVRHVIVAGAGLGGLCLAHRLRTAGIGVSVHERDTALDARPQGYRLHLDPRGVAALHRALPAPLAALLDATAGVPRPMSVVFDHRMNRLAAFTADDAPHRAVDRLTLREILYDGLADVVTFGREMVGYETRADGRVVACFADGTREAGDVLVGADGVHSAVRRQLLPHARVYDTGLVQFYGRIPLTADTRGLFTDDMDTIFTMVTGPGHDVVGVAPVRHPESPARAAARLAPDVRLTPSADYMTCSFTARSASLPPYPQLRAGTGADLRDLVLARIADWHPAVRRVVERWDATAIIPLPLRSAVPVGPWPAGPVTLLGDAIHAMSPAGGVGANTALRDADLLADALIAAAGGRPLAAAIAGYEAAMRDHGFAALRTSIANGTRFLGQDPLPV